MAEKCNYWAQEIGTQNGVIKFGAMSPDGDVTASVQIVGVDGRHFIAMEEDGKRRYWTTMNAPGAFQINAGEDLAVNNPDAPGRKNKVNQNAVFIMQRMVMLLLGLEMVNFDLKVLILRWLQQVMHQREYYGQEQMKLLNLTQRILQ